MARVVRTVTVADKQQLTPNMMRLLLEGDSLADFPDGMEGGYIKLVLDGQDKPVARSYTVRTFLPNPARLTIDMVAHGDTGPAAAWANQVDEGAHIDITGPGACQPINTAADWFLLAGDMSALPAISVNLERLPDDAVGDVVLEVISAQDQLPLNVPAGMQVHWVVNPNPEEPNSILEDTVMSLP